MTPNRRLLDLLFAPPNGQKGKKKDGPFEPEATTVELLHLRGNEATMESDTGPVRDEALENMRASIFFFFISSPPFPLPLLYLQDPTSLGALPRDPAGETT